MLWKACKNNGILGQSVLKWKRVTKLREPRYSNRKDKIAWEDI